VEFEQESGSAIAHLVATMEAEITYSVGGPASISQVNDVGAASIGEINDTSWADVEEVNDIS